MDGRVVCATLGERDVVIRRLRLTEHYGLLLSENQDQGKYPPVVVDLDERRDAIVGQIIQGFLDLR